MATTDLSSSIKSKIKTMRTLLIIFTVLHVIYFSFSIMLLNSALVNTIWIIILVMFYINYVVFIWRMPIDRFDKCTETIMACIFGLFAMWMWIQFNDIEKSN